MENERKHIAELLEHFMQGETTLDEERLLGDWLRSHEVDNALKPYQQMFAAFDDGLPAQQTQPTHRHSHFRWWHWAAAATIACLLAIGGTRLVMSPSHQSTQQPVVAKTTDDNPKSADTAHISEQLVKTGQIKNTPTNTAKTATKPKPKSQRQPSKPTPKDSAEIVHTAGDLELAESEYLAEQMELEQQLQQLRRQRTQQLSGWHYTTLPCQ